MFRLKSSPELMPRKPSVAIVVPVLNEGSGLGPLIRMLRETGADEVVFVDGGSTDSSGEVLEETGVCWYACKPGRARQMNLGASKTESDILLFLHADTTISSSSLEEVRRVMGDKETVAGRFDIRLSGQHFMHRVIAFFVNWRSRLTRISTGDQAMFVRRDVFEKLGGFPEQPLMEDIELSRRLKPVGKIACLREKVMTSSRRWEAHGILRTILLMWWLRFRYWLGADPAELKRHYVNQR